MPRTLEENKFLRKLGKRIVHLRKERDLSQIDFAFMLDIEDSALRRIEKGRTNPTSITILRIVKALDISLEKFYSEGF